MQLVIITNVHKDVIIYLTKYFYTMKTLLNFAFVILISALSINANANSNPLDGSPVALENQVLDMLGQVDFDLKEETKLTVHFLINKDKEIVIVDIDSDNSKLETFVQNKIDEEIVQGSSFEINKIYSLPIKFVTK